MGPAVCLSPGAISMKEDWVQGAPLHSHTQTSYAGTRDYTRHRARVALYNCLFTRSIVALCSGVGDKIPPWGKGLKPEEVHFSASKPIQYVQVKGMVTFEFETFFNDFFWSE